MIGTMKRVALCAAVVALGGMTVGCGDDGGDPPVDAGRDAGRDSGMTPDEDSGTPDDDGGTPGEDAGRDAGPPPPNLRLAHLIPGAPDVHICLYPPGSPTGLLITRNAAGAPTAVPYRGVSNYVDSLTLPPVNFTVKVYAASAVTGSDCPAAAATEPAAAITQTINGATFVGGNYYTVAAVGLLDGTGDTAARLIVSTDDLTPPDTGKTHIRLFHAIPNLALLSAAAAAVDVCFDPDGPGDMAAVELFENVAFTDVEAYLEADPVLVGLLTIHAHVAAAPNCFMDTQLLQIPVPIPVPTGEGIPANIVPTFTADTINTIFAVGDARYFVPPIPCEDDATCVAAAPVPDTNPVCGPAVGGTRRCANPRGPSIVPWRDNLDL